MDKRKEAAIPEGVNDLERRVTGAEEMIEDTTSAKLNLDETGPSRDSRAVPKRR